MIVKIKHDSNKEVNIYTYLCQKHGVASYKAFTCPCLKDYPPYIKEIKKEK